MAETRKPGRRARPNVAIEPGDRKVCSILFVDIVKSTVLIGGMDPDEALARLGPAVQEIITTCDEYDATVRYTGDGAVAVFGYPRADEDHALKAVECARAIIERTGGMGDERVDLRLGIHTGEVLISNVTHTQFTELALSGTVVHLARKIEEAARPNCVTVSEDVVDLIGEMYRHRFVRELEIDGSAARMKIHEVLSRNDSVSRWQSRARKGLSPFVGREEELALLDGAWRDVRAGRGRAVLLVGPAGVGKSRLVHEFLRQAGAEGHAILEFGCSSLDQGAAYLPVTRELSRRLRTAPPGDGAEAAALPPGLFDPEDAGERLLHASLDSVLGTRAADDSLQNIEPTEKKRLILRSLQRGIEAAAGEGPCILLFEDVHWADAETEELIAQLVERRSGTTLVLVTSRTGDRVRDTDGLEVVSLSPLAAPVCRQLIGSLLSALPVSGEMQEGMIEDLIAHASDRTPLFIEEIVHHLNARHAGRRGDGLLSFDEIVRIPTSVEPLIAQRIDALEPEEKRALQVASAIGSEVQVDVLVPALERINLDGKLGVRRLETLRLLQPVGGSGSTKYRFEHALIQQVAYQSIPNARRRHMHRDLLAVLEAGTAERDLQVVQSMAHHAERGEVWLEAARAYVQCGQLAVDRVSFDSAVRHFEAALRCLEKAEGDRRELVQLGIAARRGLRVALLPRADFTRIFRLAGEVEALAADVGDEDAAIRALVDKTIMQTIQGDVRAALRAGHAALARAEALDHSSLSANAAFALGQAHWFRGRFTAAVATIDRHEALFLTAFRKVNTGTTGTVSVLGTSTRANALSMMGRFEEAAREVERNGLVARDTGKAYDRAFSLTSRGLLLLQQRSFAASAEALEEAIATCTGAGLDVLYCFIAAPLARAHGGEQRFTQAWPVLRRGLEIAEHMRMSAFSAGLLASRLYLLGREGRRQEAEAQAPEVLALCRRNGYLGLLAIALADAAAAAPGTAPAERRRRAALRLARVLRMQPLAERLAEPGDRL